MLIRLLQISLLALLLTQYPVAYSKQTVVFCTDILPPFTIAADPYVAGNDIRSRLMQEIFKHIENMDATLFVTSWKSCQSSVRRGKVDGILLIFKSPEREKYYVFTEPLVFYKEAIFYNIQKTPEGRYWKSLNDLVGLRVGLQKGFSYPNPVNQMIATGELIPEYVENIRQNLLKLSNMRIDFILEGEITTHYIVNKLKLSNHIRQSFTVTDAPLNIAFSKKSKARNLVDRINRIIIKITENGQLDKIINDNY